MIDTICLLIPKEEMIYLSGNSNWDLHSKTEYYSKYVRNPNKLEKSTGKYFPRLTGYKRNFSQSENVRIEFSAPKLLYLNNLDELEDKDFPKIVETLQERLKMMGVIAEKETLENSSVSSVHFSKNILLENNYTVSYLISEIGKINLNKAFDFGRARFLNDGQSLYAHTTSHQLVIYDKIADLGKKEKKAIDKNQTKYQMSLFEKMKEKKELNEIIRFEIRLSQKQKMNKVITSLGYNKNPTLRDIFNQEISQKIVYSYWEKLIKSGNMNIFLISLSSKEVFQKLLLSDKKMTTRKGIYLTGLLLLSKDDNGMGQLRSIITKKNSDRTWHRTVKEIRSIEEAISKNNMRNWIKQIDEKLQNYKPYKVKKYD